MIRLLAASCTTPLSRTPSVAQIAHTLPSVNSQSILYLLPVIPANCRGWFTGLSELDCLYQYAFTPGLQAN